MIKETAFGIVILLLVISLAVLFCALLIKLYLKKIKEHNRKELEFQKTLNQTIIETQEQVFENISQDLHDDIGQQLTFMNFQLEKIKIDPSPEPDDLVKLSQSIFDVSQSIRNLSHSLNNQIVMQNDLVKAIGNELERIRKYKNMSVSFEYSGEQRPFSDTQKIIIFRIFQETIANCLKHAKATKIDIRLNFSPKFILTIADNGIGFDHINNQNKGSLGLVNIKKRADVISFETALDSQPGKGTRLTLSEKT